MDRFFLWMFCPLLSVLHADHPTEQQTNSCGTFSLITSRCKGSKIYFRYTPSTSLNVSKVDWTLDHFIPGNPRWEHVQNSTEISIFANDSGHYIVWRTRGTEISAPYFLITVHSQPGCREPFTPINVRYKEFKDCTTNKPEVEEPRKHTFKPSLSPKDETKDDGTTASYTTVNVVHVTLPTNRKNGISSVSKGPGATKRGTTHRTTNMDSGMNDVKGTENKDSEPTDADKTEDNKATTRLGSRIGINTPETNIETWSTEQNTKDNFDHGTVARKANAAHSNDSQILNVILATLGGFMCVVVIVIAILVYRKRQGNRPQNDNGDRSLQQGAQRDRCVRNEYEFDSQDTPEVLYAQVEKKHKTLQNASLAAQFQTNETDRHDGNVQQTETVTLKEEETMANVTTNKSIAVPNNEDNKQELVYIELDMDHLNKSSVQRKSTERNDEDKTEYVGIDFAKTSQIQAN